MCSSRLIGFTFGQLRTYLWSVMELEDWNNGVLPPPSPANNPLIPKLNVHLETNRRYDGGREGA